AVPDQTAAVIHGYSRAQVLLRDLDHLRHATRNYIVAALRDVLVPNRHGRGRLPQSAHKLRSGCAALTAIAALVCLKSWKRRSSRPAALPCPLPVLWKAPPRPICPPSAV